MVTWFLVLVALLVLTVVFSKKLRYYYYVFQLPGPFFVPLLGTIELFLKDNDLFHAVLKVISGYPSVLRMYIGPFMHIVTSRPQDLDLILSTCLDKGYFYDGFNDLMYHSLLTAPLPQWRKNRKLINHTFNPRIINSFQGIFTRHAKIMTAEIDGMYVTGEKDLMMTLWKYTLKIAVETLTDSYPSEEFVDKYVWWMQRQEEIQVERIHTPWLNIKPIWQVSNLRKECLDITYEGRKCLQNIVDEALKNKLKNVENEPLKEYLFLNYLLGGCEKDIINNNQILEETKLMFMASSETTASTVTFVLLALGIHQEIQDLVYTEVVSTIPDNHQTTIEDINRLEYLERVIKETMRIKPPVPFLVRSIDKDIYSEPYIFPAGCDALISIEKLHKNPEIWENPLKFDPDRFLPEQVEKRHRCSFIPFSYGTRNCVGLKYAMLSMKCILAEIIKNYKVKTFFPTTLNDVDVVYNIIVKPKGYSMQLEKRN